MTAYQLYRQRQAWKDRRRFRTPRWLAPVWVFLGGTAGTVLGWATCRWLGLL